MIKRKRVEKPLLKQEPILEKGVLDRDPLFRKIFEELPIGVIFYNVVSRSIIYHNRFFDNNSFNKKDVFRIISFHIDQSLENAAPTNVGKEIIINTGGRSKTFGFSSYLIDSEVCVILLSDIASKTVFSNTKQENIFYDKLSELIAEVAHEIGNPLAGINMSLQVLLNNIQEWPSQKLNTYISRTILEIDRLSDFLKSIREVSKETQLNLKWIDLHAIIRKLYLQNSELINQKKINVENLVGKGIEVFIDENAFYQIILNLLNNSLQILQPNQRIDFFIEEIDNFFVKLVFRNNGDPIDDRLLEKIFSPFFTTKRDGEGIGLTISLKLMTRMGGTIKAERPEDGKGAKFVIYIPNKKKNYDG